MIKGEQSVPVEFTKQNSTERLKGFFGLVPVEKKELWFRKNKEKIGAIVQNGFKTESSDESEKKEQLLEALFSYQNFKTKQFEFEDGKVSGKEILEALEVHSPDDFYEMTANVFPEESGALFLLDSEEPHNMAYVERRRQLIKQNEKEQGSSQDISGLKKSAGLGDEKDSDRLLAELLGADMSEGRSPFTMVEFRKYFDMIRKSLTPQEQAVVQQILETGKSLPDVAADFNISRSRAHQIFDQVLIKIERVRSKDEKQADVSKSASESTKEYDEKTVSVIKERVLEEIGLNVKNLSVITPVYSLTGHDIDSIRQKKAEEYWKKVQSVCEKEVNELVALRPSQQKQELRQLFVLKEYTAETDDVELKKFIQDFAKRIKEEILYKVKNDFMDRLSEVDRKVRRKKFKQQIYDKFTELTNLVMQNNIADIDSENQKLNKMKSIRKEIEDLAVEYEK